MARGNIALGKFRGKVGGHVLRVDPGVGQIISEYNPHPSNPRTAAQTVQRNKMNLAGQISSLTPKAVLLGLDSNSRKARSMFVSNIIKHCVAGVTEGTQELKPENIILSKGMTANVSGAITKDDEHLTFTVTLTGNETANGVLGCLVMAYIAHEGKFVKGDMRNLAAGTASADFDMSSMLTLAEPTAKIEVYVVPIIETDGGVTTLYGELSTAIEAGYAMQVSVARSIAALGGYCDSIYIGNKTLTREV